MTADTIAALATAYGPGALAVIRISGPQAVSILRHIFRPRRERAEFSSHHLYHGDVVCPRTGTHIDEVLACVMAGPHSYTGEDVVEIFCHGGMRVPQAVLATVIAAGARPAARGEFTRRAFLNGRLDLAQAEAVEAVINARGDEGRELALRHLKGEFSAVIEAFIRRLKDVLARLEASIDFVEDIEEGTATKALDREIRTLRDELHALAKTYGRGRVYKEGAAIVILGRPNVGKSSLLNCLLGRKRAIVTPIPGTTRDFLEEFLPIKGIFVRIIDTAGIRPTRDELEEAGIEVVWERISEADLVLLLLDGSERLTPVDREIMTKIEGKRVLTVINKKDLPPAWEVEEIARAFPPPFLHISAKYGEGIEELKDAIHAVITDSGAEQEGGIVVMQERHLHCLERAKEALNKGLEYNLSRQPEIVVEEVRAAVRALGEITGTEGVTLDVLDVIFSTFCVGK